MRLIKQPKGSNQCGQHCVAIIAGVAPADVIKVIGKTGCTSTKHLVKSLRHYGFECPDRLELIRKDVEYPDMAILKVTWAGKGSHWVVLNNGAVLDPVYGVYLFSDYLIIMDKGINGRITSFLKVDK